MGFHEQISSQLKPLNKEQMCLFAWLCGLRALPVLSVGKSFVYWTKEEKQKHLYSIFHALDACAGVWSLKITDASAIAATAANAAKAAAEAAARTTDKKTTKNAAWIAWTASDVSSAAAWAARTASATNADANAAINAASWAFRASTTGGKGNDLGRFASDNAFWGPGANTRIANNNIFGKTRENDIDVIFNSIAAIKNNDLTILNKDTSIYGVIWNNFLEDKNNTSIYGVIWNNFLKELYSADCAYWARFYENLFKNKFIIKDRFIINEEELGRRLFGVPDAIRAEGAAAVGQYLEHLGNEV